MQQGTFARLVAFARRSVAVTWMAACVCFAGFAAWAQGANEAVDAEEVAECEASDDMSMEEPVVTGIRIARTAGELGEQVIVIYEGEIKATGETSLESLLRQLPQNQNPTTEQFGQRLSTGTNFTGASTINNLPGRYGESKIFNSEGEELEPRSPSGSPLRGSLLQFSFCTSIGR